MWSRARHELLKVLSEDHVFMSRAELAKHLRRSNDRTFRKWLAGLQEIGLIQYEPSGRIVVTPSGRSIGTSPYVGLVYLRVMWCVAGGDGPLTIGDIYQRDPDGPCPNDYLRAAMKVRHVKKEEVYRDRRYQYAYSVTQKGALFLRAHEPLRRLLAG